MNFVRWRKKSPSKPHMGRARPELGEGLRIFPHREYLLIYRVQPEGIGVARVVHGKRDLPNIDFPFPPRNSRSLRGWREAISNSMQRTVVLCDLC